MRNSLGCVLGQLGSVPGSATSFSHDLGEVSLSAVSAPQMCSKRYCLALRCSAY